MYKLAPMNDNIVIRIEDSAVIPNDPQNIDRIAYNLWREAGNTPFPADPVAQSVPASIERYQAKMQLIAIGEYDNIKVMIDNPATPEAMRVGFYDAQNWHRDSDMVKAMAQQKGWTPEYVDQLFIQASQIK